MPIDSRGTELGNSDQDAFPSASKNTTVDLVPLHAFKCVPPAIFGGVDISEVPRCYLLRQMRLQLGS